MEVNQKQCAFTFYQMERKEIIKQEPELTFPQIVSNMPVKWNNMSEAERSKYRKLADEERKDMKGEKGNMMKRINLIWKMK
jgi:hypothetical protein